MLAVPLSAGAGETPVGTALVLLSDVSGSIDANEYGLQRAGIEKAFRDPGVVKAIMAQPYGVLAVTLIEWSSTQQVVVPWTIVHDEATANRFADAVARAQRTSEGATFIGDAITAGLAALKSCPCRPARRVIDVSGDGQSNGGRVPVDEARDEAVAWGATVNGLAIPDPLEANLVEHYRDHVMGGVGSFVTEAAGFDDFARALRRKLMLEIADARP